MVWTVSEDSWMALNRSPGSSTKHCGWRTGHVSRHNSKLQSFNVGNFPMMRAHRDVVRANPPTQARLLSRLLVWMQVWRQLSLPGHLPQWFSTTQQHFPSPKGWLHTWPPAGQMSMLSKCRELKVPRGAWVSTDHLSAFKGRLWEEATSWERAE